MTGRPVSELQARYTSREFAELIALGELEGWPEANADARAATLTMTLTAALTGRVPTPEEVAPDREASARRRLAERGAGGSAREGRGRRLDSRGRPGMTPREVAAFVGLMCRECGEA